MKTLKINSLIFALVLVVLSTISIKSQTASLDPNFNAGVAEGVVQVVSAAIQPDGKILVGGGFSLANGFERNTLVRLNPDGTLDTTFNMGGIGPSSTVREIVVLPDGKILVSGTFAAYNGEPTPAGLIRLNSNGSLDITFNPGGTGIRSGTNINSTQNIALLPDGKFMIGGTFDNYNGTPIKSVARINADGTLDTTFTSRFAQFEHVEEVDVQSDGKILVGGPFQSYDGQARSGVARLNADGSLDSSFVPATNQNTGIAAMIIQSDGKILIGGADETSGLPLVKRLNTDGTNDASFVPPAFLPGGYPEYFAIQPDGKILVTGKLSTASQLNIGLMRLNSTGSLDSSFTHESVDNFGYRVHLQTDGKIILGGYFIRYGGQTRKHIVRLDSNGAVDSSFNPTLVGWGYAVSMAQQADGKIIVGGNFLVANNAARINVTRFNPNGTIDPTFIPGTGTTPDSNAQNIINTIALQTDGKILIGGGFSSYNGVSRRALVRLNANGSVDAAFNPAFLNNFSPVTINDILVLPDGKIIVGGSGFNNSVFLFWLNPDGSLYYPTNNTGGQIPSTSIRKILRQTDGKLIIAGAFNSYNGTTRQRIARINADSTLDTSFNSSSGANSTSTINDAALQPDGKILIGGTFNTYAGTTVNRIARLNSDGTLDGSFNVGTGFNGNVESITVQPGTNRIFVGGRFSSYNGVATNRFVVLNPDGSIYTALGSGFDSDARFLVRKLLFQTDGHLLVSGLFKQYSNTSKLGILRLLTGPTTANLKISGNVTVGNNPAAALAGVSVALGGDGSNSATTDADGKYTFDNLAAGGNYTISVNKTGFNFPSNNQAFSDLQADQIADFNGAQLCVPPPSGSSGGAGNCENASETPKSPTTGDPIAVTANNVNLTFGNVTAPGTTVATEVAPESTGALPNNYTFLAGATAYDVRTSASFAGSIEVCFPVANDIDPAVFSQLAVLHNENGNLVDRTSSRDFAARKICASVTSLSPFGLAVINPPTKASISGLIAYGTSPANQTQKFVPGVVFTASESAATTTSNLLGTYLLGDLNAGGTYTVTVSKNGDVNGITGSDATLVLRCLAVGTANCTLTANQRIAGDADGNGKLSPTDATMILRHSASSGRTPYGQIGNWKFNPQSSVYSALNNSRENENYEALLVGDVNGSWKPPGSAMLAEAGDEITQTKEINGNNARSSKGKPEINGNILTIPIKLTEVSSKSLSGFSFAVMFDPNVLQPADSAIVAAGTLSNGFHMVTDTSTPGRLGIAAGGREAAVAANDTLLYLRFKVVGKTSARSKTAIANVGFAESVFENDKGAAFQTTLAPGSF